MITQVLPVPGTLLAEVWLNGHKLGLESVQGQNQDGELVRLSTDMILMNKMKTVSEKELRQ